MSDERDYAEEAYNQRILDTGDGEDSGNRCETCGARSVIRLNNEDMCERCHALYWAGQGVTPHYTCDKCGMPAKPAQPDRDPDAAKWYHVSVADDVFCGLVMHAADRIADR